MKLTKAQKELLASLPSTCVHYYKPAVKLVEFGLAKWDRGTPGGPISITDAGSKALEGGEWTS